MTWQEPTVAIIVSLAVVSLYRHLRDLVGSAAPDADASCHGCDDCDTTSDPTPLDQSANVVSGARTRIH